MQEKLFFKSSKGHKLCGIISNPSGNQDKPIIILVHGHHSSKDSKTYVRFEEEFNKHSFSTFRIDLFGHGESDGEIENATVTEAVDDILCAISFIKELGYQKIGLIGSSFGGIASIMVASKCDDLFALGLKCPVCNYIEKEEQEKTKEELDSWKRDGFFHRTKSNGTQIKINYSVFEDFKNHDGYRAAPLIKIPTIIVHGDKDITVPLEQSIKTSKRIPDCELVIIKGADHYFRNHGEHDKVFSAIVNFIVEKSK